MKSIPRNSKFIIKKYSFGLVLALAYTVFLAACGNQSSQPLKKYSAMKKQMGPVHNVPTPTQTYIPSDLFSLYVDPSTPTNLVVGQRNIIRFQTSLNLKGAKYRLVSRDLPRGSEPLKDLGQGLWEYAWTPSRELIPHNINEPIRGGFHVSLEIFEVTDPQAQQIVPMLATEREIQYTLLRSGEAPEIVEITHIAPYPQLTKLSQGDVIDMEIMVKDPSSSPSQKPRLIPLAIPNNIGGSEKKLISGHGFLFLETEPTLVQAGLWKFVAHFDTKNNAVPEFSENGQPSKDPSILANLVFQVLSANRTLSVEKTVSFEITYRRELLRPAFKANPEVQTVAQATNWSYSFESYLPSVVGTMTTFLSEDTVKLAGTPKISCTSNRKDPNQQKCTINWKIPCSVTPGEVLVKVTAAAEYQGQTTATELIKKLVVEENKKCVPVAKQSDTVSTAQPALNQSATNEKSKPTETPKTESKPSTKTAPAKTLSAPAPKSLPTLKPTTLGPKSTSSKTKSASTKKVKTTKKNKKSPKSQAKDNSKAMITDGGKQ